jgi:ATP-dependent exoDNAse (exonuclease V) alpha subunit
MQIKNNYNTIWENKNKKVKGCGVFNGDIGYITSLIKN